MTKKMLPLENARRNSKKNKPKQAFIIRLSSKPVEQQQRQQRCD